MPRARCEGQPQERVSTVRKFHFTAEVTFDGSVHEIADTSDVEDFSDDSYFGSDGITLSGGSVSFTGDVEAEDADEAERLAEEIAEGVVSEGNEVQDYSGITWLVENVSASVEVEVPEMTLERAAEILNALAESGDLDAEAVEAVKFLLDEIAALRQRLASVETKLAEATKDLAEVKALLPAVPAVPAVEDDRPF